MFLGQFGPGINTQKYAYDKLKKMIDHNVVLYNFFQVAIMEII